MEYLEMRGAVKLKADADNAVVRSVLSKLRETEFVDAGYIDIGIEGNTLSVSAEGTISESYTTYVVNTAARSVDRNVDDRCIKCTMGNPRSTETLAANTGYATTAR